LIFTGYGFWLPNDPRGSGSTEIRSDPLEPLGPILPGRQPVQPLRDELRAFYRRANPKLTHDPIWFDEALRDVITSAFATAVRDFRYTCYACSVCSNHAHLVIRRHRDDGDTIWDSFAGRAKQALLALPGVAEDHPVWANRPYVVFLYTPGDVRHRVGYVNGNPMKEGLPHQSHPFVTAYDGWPFRGR